jgi:hypothetical protein
MDHFDPLNGAIGPDYEERCRWCCIQMGDETVQPAVKRRTTIKLPNMREHIRFIIATHPLLVFPQPVRALQRLAPAIGDAIDDPVALLFSGNKILLFEDTKMVRKF